MFDSSGGVIDFTLVDTGQTYVLIVKDATNSITIVPDTGLINGGVSYSLGAAYTKLTAVFDGTDWYI